MAEITAVQAQSAFETAELIWDHQQISTAIDKMAAEISREIGGQKALEHPPLVLCVMNGGLIFCGQLLPRLNFPLHVDYLHASRYRNTTTGFELNWQVYPREPLVDRVVLIVDDILDEGFTLDAIAKHCSQQGALKVMTAVLIEKLHQRRAPGVSSDFIGLKVEDRYVFGYGMDYRGYLRNANGIYAVREL